MTNVIKATGEIVPFDEIKVLNSIRRAGIPQELQSQVLAHIERKLYDRIPTFEIYHHIIEFLGRSDQPYSRARYSLKEALMMLGPSGYPFEDFVAKILEAEGYQTQVRQILIGKCVSHEIDVVAKKDGKTIMVEAKFHNNVGTRSDVHVSLYTKARFDDIKEKHHLDEAWIMTNTKTTIDANDFATCVGMKVISWSYPDNDSLRDLIERANLHPITMLTTISASQKLKLLTDHIVICKDLRDHPEKLQVLSLSDEQKEQTMAELEFICKTEADILPKANLDSNK